MSAARLSLCLLFAAVANPSAAQAQDRPPLIAVDLSAGIMLSESGGTRCGAARGPTAGLEVSGGRKWRATVAADVLLGVGPICAAPGQSRIYQGRDVEVVTVSELVFAPRLVVRIDRRIDLGDGLLIPGIGFGYIGVAPGTHGDEMFWGRWIGMNATFRPQGSRFGFGGETGLRQRPVQYIES